MKGKFKILIVVAVIAMLALAACAPQAADPAPAPAPAASGSDEPAAAPAAAAEKKLIGVNFPSTDVERWPKEAEIIKNGLEAVGHEVIIQYGENDANAQMQQCDNMLSQGIDILILAAVDTVSAAEVVNKAHQEGVPVMAYCRMIQDVDLDYFVAEDNEMVGTLQGTFMRENLDSGNVMLLSGDPQDINAVLYLTKAKEAIQPKLDSGEFTLVAEQYSKNWQPIEAMKHVENALTQNNNDIQGVICTNDTTAAGAVEALAAQQLAGITVVTGGDGELQAAKRILEGTQTMTVFKDPRPIASASVEAVIAILNGGQPNYNGSMNNGFKDVQAVLVDMSIVTKDNLVEEMVDTGFFTMAQLEG